MNDWCIEHHKSVRALSLRISTNKIYICIVWPDRCVSQIKTLDLVCARGNNEVHQEMDPFAANSYARWKFGACRPRVLSKGDA